MVRRWGILTAALVCVGLTTGCGTEVRGKAQPYDPRAPDPVPVVMPAGAYWISQQFAPSQEGIAYSHRGIDVRAPVGVPVLAAAPGRVIQAFSDTMHGQQVVVDHGRDIDGATVVTRYHHLSRTDVRPGQMLARGDRIGGLGQSGLASVAVHLHFELRRGPSVLKADPVDPQFYWVGGVGKVTCFDSDQQYQDVPIRLTYPVLCQ